MNEIQVEEAVKKWSLHEQAFADLQALLQEALADNDKLKEVIRDYERRFRAIEGSLPKEIG